MASAVCFNIDEEIPSGPLDFVTSSVSSKSCTSSSVQSRDISVWLFRSWLHIKVRGRKAVLKQEEKKLFSILAFSVLCEATVSP